MGWFTKTNKVFDSVDGVFGKVWIDGEELFDVVRCCPDEHWAETMLRDEDGHIRLNTLQDATIVVRIVGKHIRFKPDIEQMTAKPKQTKRKGNQHHD